MFLGACLSGDFFLTKCKYMQLKTDKPSGYTIVGWGLANISALVYVQEDCIDSSRGVIYLFGAYVYR